MACGSTVVRTLLEPTLASREATVYYRLLLEGHHQLL